MRSRLFPSALLGVMASPVLAADLEIEIAGARNNDGDISVLAFSDAQGFSNADPRRATATVVVPARKSGVSITLSNLPDGRYALMALHDEDRDGELAMDGSIPAEGYGYSGGHPPEEEPTFEKAVIDPALGPAGIVLVYW